jgi:hypothetical protein
MVWRANKSYTTMSDLNPTLITKEQKDGANQIMAMNRRERRRIGKQLHVKIPGTNQPRQND